MAKITVPKKSKAAPAPEPDIEIADLGSDYIDDIGDLGDDLLDEDIDLDLSEVDDLGVSVDDVEAAMQSISPSASMASASPAAALPGIAEAALAALAHDVARVLKAAEKIDTAPIVEGLEFQRQQSQRIQDQIAGIAVQIENLTQQVETLSRVSSARTVAPAASVPVAVGPSTDFSAIDAFIKQQFNLLTTGRVYPAEKVAEVFVKRNAGDAVTVGTMMGRMKVVLADAFERANREGFFSK